MFYFGDIFVVVVVFRKTLLLDSLLSKIDSMVNCLVDETRQLFWLGNEIPAVYNGLVTTSPDGAVLSLLDFFFPSFFHSCFLSFYFLPFFFFESVGRKKEIVYRREPVSIGVREIVKNT